jgi:hypothetical protein
MATPLISLSELNALLNDLPGQTVQDATANNMSFIAFSPVDQSLINLGQPPMSVALSDEGYGDSGTHDRGGNYNAADLPEYSQPRHKDWARYDRSIKYSNQDRTTLAQAGDTALINRVQNDRANAERTLMTIFNGHLMTNNPEASPIGTNDVNGVSGITHAISSSNTYMQTDRTTETWFQSVVVPGAVTSANMDSVIETIEDTRKGRVDAILCDSTQAKAIAALTGAASAVYNVDVMGNVLTPVIGERSPFGLEGFARKPICIYQTKPVYAVPGYPAKTVHFMAFGEGGWNLTYQQLPTWTEFEKVPGTASVVATLTFRPQSVYRNPWKNSGVLNVP